MNYPKTIGQWAIFVVIVAAIVAMVWVALNQFGIAIPGWVQTVFWVLVVASVIIAAIKWLVGLGDSSPPTPPV